MVLRPTVLAAMKRYMAFVFMGLMVKTLGGTHGKTTQADVTGAITTARPGSEEELMTLPPTEDNIQHSHVIEEIWKSKELQKAIFQMKILKNDTPDPLSLQVQDHFLTCDIDNNACFEDLNRTFNWYVTSGSSGRDNIYKPERDHTYGTSAGKYWYADVKNQRNGSGAAMAKLLSPPLGVNQICAEFSYRSYGVSIGKYGLVLSQGGKIRTLWEDNGSKGNSWITRDLSFNITQDTLLFGITIIQDNSNGQGGLAIDDFRLHKGVCVRDPGPSTNPPPGLMWEPWSYCSDTCGIGFRVRFRDCSGPTCAGRRRIQTGICTERPCGQGTCGYWTSWSACSTTCGSGDKTRNRERCPSSVQNEECNIQACPFWLSWQPWGSCSLTCGEGIRMRLRSCSSNGCVGTSDETENCVQPKCPTDGSTCSADPVQLHQSVGNISSPGYLIGQNYPNNIKCQWKIKVHSQDKKILITVNSFRTVAWQDYLTICDGDSCSYPRLASLHGHVVSGWQCRSSGPDVFILFTSDGQRTGKGFSLTYQAVDPVCPDKVASLGNSSGIIASPGYDKSVDYKNAILCQWKVTIPESNKKILITLTLFKTIAWQDYLTICDGDSCAYPRLARLHGHVTSGWQCRTSGQNVFLQFTSDGHRTDKGFSLTYQAVAPVCPEDAVSFTDTSGNITSPGFLEGHNYQNAIACQWKISIPEKKNNILITLKLFRTKAWQDYLTICDGDSCTYPKLARLHGYVTSGWQCRTSGQNVFLQFTTDPHETDQGFSLTYEAVAPVCPEDAVSLTGSSGILTSPGYLEGHNYQNAIACQWKITIPENNMKILLTVEAFRTIAWQDYLTICDGDSCSYATLAKLHGQVVTGWQCRSSGKNVYLKFTSDNHRTDKGFSVSYQAVEPVCSDDPVVMTSSSGSISSPGYVGGNNYKNAISCQWKITAASSNMKILLTMKSFKTVAWQDYLTICDGDSCLYPRLARLHGEVASGSQYRSSGQNLYLLFKADGHRTDKGFSLTYEFV